MVNWMVAVLFADRSTRSSFLVQAENWPCWRGPGATAPVTNECARGIGMANWPARGVALSAARTRAFVSHRVGKSNLRDQLCGGEFAATAALH